MKTDNSPIVYLAGAPEENVRLRSKPIRNHKSLTEDLPKMYLSNSSYTMMTEEREKKWLSVTGCKYRCWSYVNVGPGTFQYNPWREQMLKVDIKQGVGIMMDSGAFSFHRFMDKKRKAKYHLLDDEALIEETINGYTNFIRKTGKAYDFYVNFDYVMEPETIYKVQKRLEKAGIRPIPVYHGDYGLEWFERYLKEGYDYIGFGTPKSKRKDWRSIQQLFDSAFDLIEKYQVRGRKIKTHGFAKTNFATMFLYPFYSVDSASWVKASMNGIILIPTNKGLKLCHVSKRDTDFSSAMNRVEGVALKHIKDFVESRGFDYSKMQTERWHRDLFNGYIFAHVHEFKAAYMAHRGEKTKWQTLL